LLSIIKFVWVFYKVAGGPVWLNLQGCTGGCVLPTIEAPKLNQGTIYTYVYIVPWLNVHV